MANARTREILKGGGDNSGDAHIPQTLSHLNPAVVVIPHRPCSRAERLVGPHANKGPNVFRLKSGLDLEEQLLDHIAAHSVMLTDAPECAQCEVGVCVHKGRSQETLTEIFYPRIGSLGSSSLTGLDFLNHSTCNADECRLHSQVEVPIGQHNSVAVELHLTVFWSVPGCRS